MIKAREAVDFYVSVFKNSKKKNSAVIDGTPSGEVNIISFEISGQEITAMNAGPYFSFNDSVSFFYYCGSESEIDRIYKLLSENGSILFPLAKYDWSSRYAWVRDRFGIGWQLDVDDINSKQKIVPALLFVNEKSGRIREALSFYASVFKTSRLIMDAPYGNQAEGTISDLLFAQFSVEGFIFNAMSSNMKHDFDFNEAISFMINCGSQDEVDYYWNKLTTGGQEQQCGWVKDKFGVSWQVVPSEMGKLMASGDKEQSERVMSAMLKMKKLDINTLKKAYDKG
ncbi:MAG: VOC family protein [Bacteroidetes bacterium]|nr:VOC family protein [Bacteroidota bacterium]